ncbi:MAG: hypothetical protein L0099_07290 [Acidobacteria bacterium]|nr:hypothetical protein [Acidobacteriota bacterium]
MEPRKEPRVLIRSSSDAPRRQLIREVVKEWYDLNPRHARRMAHFINEITKVEVHEDGRWKGGQGQVVVRLPADLWHTMRFVFAVKLPDEPLFGYDEGDIRIVAEEFPKLVPTKKRLRKKD